MGLFDFLKGVKPVTDEVFGKLTKYKEPEGEVYSCDPIFAPIGVAINCVMDTEGEESTEAQKNFYRKIEAEYDHILLPKIAGILSESSKGEGGNDNVNEFKAQYELAAMDLPHMQQRPLQWKLIYLCIDKSKPDFTVSFSDYEPKSIN